MMCLFRCLISVFLLCANSALAEGINIKVEISDIKSEGEPLTLLVCKDLYAICEPDLRGDRYESIAENGVFTFHLKDTDSLTYVQFVFGAKAPFEKRYHAINRKFFLLRAGSDIQLSVRDTVLFYGPGAALMECQYKMYQMGQKMAAEETGSYYDNLLKQKEMYEDYFGRQLDLLLSYQHKLSPNEMALLKADFFADYNDLNLKSIRMEPTTDNLYYKQQNLDALRFYTENYLYENLIDLDSAAMTGSRSLTAFLYTKNLLDLGIIMRITDKTMRPTFTQLYERISRNYQGELKERLLVNLFIRYFTRGEAQSAYFDDAIRNIKNEKYRHILVNMQQAMATSMKAFNFSLTDASGNTVTADMLKGKILVLDFWFVGCGGCAYLNKKMQPVYEYYQKNEDVIFVSINMDKDEQKWKRGLSSGLYTHEGSLNLYTNGLGREDALVKFYNISSYPTLIIIGKDQRVISASPPKPDTEEGIGRFIRLIDQHL